MKFIFLIAALASFSATAETVCREDFGGQHQECAEVRQFPDGSVSLFISDTEGVGGVTYLEKGQDQIIFPGTKEETTVEKIISGKSSS